MKANQNFRNADDAVSPVIGVILMVAITVVLAAVVFVLVSDLGDTGDQTPQVTFTKSGAGEDAILTVQNAPANLDWSDFTGSTTAGDACEPVLPTGAVTAGGSITFQDGQATPTPTTDECIGVQFSLVHTATNGVAARSTL